MMRVKIGKSVVIAAVVVGSQVLGDNSNRIERLKLDYGYESWRDTTRFDYPRFVESDWTIGGLSLPTNGLDVGTCASSFGGRRRFIVLQDEDVVFEIDYNVCMSCEEAKSSILKYFADMAMRVQFQNITNGVGDVLFYRRHPGDVDSAAFARNNVFVSVNSYMPLFSATNIARQIDVSVLRASGIMGEVDVLEGIGD